MAWSSKFPNGNLSVKANEAIGQGNTTYIEETMGNQVVGTNTNNPQDAQDHFWDVDPNLDGRHRFVTMPEFTVGGAPADPFVANGSNVVYYAKLLSATESTAQQDVQAFFKNNDTAVMQLLGIRAMGVFTANTGSNPTQAEVVYSHNLALQSAGTPGIVRNSLGRFTITFANALPSANYLALGLCMREASPIASDEGMYMYIPRDNTLTNSKSTTTLKIGFRNPMGSHHDPLQAWFVCFGG